jgi:hypothetical protein
MSIPEAQLDTWSHQGSVPQSKTTYATIKRALEAPDTKYARKNFQIFLQGSYGNDTNIYAESDVDVIICSNDLYYYDTTALDPYGLTLFNGQFIPAPYQHGDFKADVVEALAKSFGTDVTAGNKAIKVKANGNRRSADVVVAAEFRRYYSGGIGLQYTSGICFFNSGGVRIANYPKQHSANCTSKHQATNGWFKPMVRVLKNMRSRLVDDGKISGADAPSYFLEGLLYNVPNDKFGRSYSDSYAAAMRWILEAQRNTFLCANEQYYLVRDGFPECWPYANCDKFINAAVALWNQW